MLHGRTLALAVTVTWLLLAGLCTASSAQLGCFEQSIATCSDAGDCAAVGGIDCTSGACLCTEGPSAPYCPCESRPSLTMAPALSSFGLVCLIAVLAAIGLLWIKRSRTANT